MRGGIACECVLIGSRRCARVPRLGAAGEVARWFETPVAFARWCLCGIETAIAFAGVKWAFLVQFSGAEVMSVSAVPCCGCAVVLLVSTSPCFCVLGEFFRGTASGRAALGELCRAAGLAAGPIYRHSRPFNALLKPAPRRGPAPLHGPAPGRPRPGKAPISTPRR